MNRFFFTFIFLAFIGCSPIPKIKTEKIINPNSIQTNIPNDRTLIFSCKEWWKIYKDPILDRLVSFALEENEDLKIAKLNISKSDEAIKLADSALGVSIDSSSDLKRERLGKNGMTPPPFGGKIITIGSLGLQGDYNIDIFNKLHSLADEQKYRCEAVKLNSDWIELNITNRVAKLYFYWNYLQQEKKILLSQKDILTEIVSFNKKNVQIGNGINSDIWQSENELRNIDSALKDNSLNLQLTLNNLNILTGNKHNKEIAELLNGKYSMADVVLKERIAIPSTISSDIIINRPDIKYYIMLIKGQEKHLKAEKTNFYPQFSLTGQIGFEGITMEKILRRDSLLGFISPSIYLPIFHSGAITSKYKMAGEDLNIFIEEYNNAVITALNNIESELYKTKISCENLKTSDVNLSVQTKILKENRERLTIGSISKLDYLLKELDWNNYKLSNKKELFNFSTQQLTLLNSLGGAYKIEK
ncbi:MAG: TolC family protein [Fusobacterium sp.]|uniref:TolC family protein n=1 Tax=Fusobacterium sp. TaxID=68766 RepID=UPI002943E0E9|nr:TolC family protein [Fusobacterium sp.]MDY3059493.1 TolC family protein [Fusobacterium sp.]